MLLTALIALQSALDLLLYLLFLCAIGNLKSDHQIIFITAFHLIAA